jgi:hypothetical protein
LCGARRAHRWASVRRKFTTCQRSSAESASP